MGRQKSWNLAEVFNFICLSNVDMEQLRNIMGCRDISGIQLKPEVKVAGLLGQRSLEKIQNEWTKILTRLTWVSRVQKVIEPFYWLITFFGFDWGQSYWATLVKPQNCPKMLRNLTFVVQFAYFSIRTKKLLFFRATIEQLSLQKATFDCFWATFWEIGGKVLENLEQLVESPYYECLFSSFAA